MQPEQKTSWLVRMRQTAKERRQRRLMRKMQPPWIWRHCPENKRKYFNIIFTFMGGSAHLLCILAAIAGFILAPLVIASEHKGSLLEVAIRWYVHLFPKHSGGSLYVITQICIAGGLFYLTGIFFGCKNRSSMRNHSKIKPTCLNKIARVTAGREF